MRVPNWDIKLAEHINSVRDYPFMWGENDCLTFVNKCVEVIRGDSFADDWLGDYTTAQGAFRKYRKLLYTQEYDTVIDMLDDRLERFDGRFPVRGSVVGRPVDQTSGIMPVMLGMVISDLGAFVSEEGMIFSTLDENDLFWSVN